MSSTNQAWRARSTKQMHTFLERLRPDDRVLLVGDVRQHEAVDAGRPYHQLQEAGIRTAHLGDIVRQRVPGLKAVVEQLSRGDVRGAVERLDHQGRVHEIGPHEQRLTAIASEYVKDPHATLVVSPDNQKGTPLDIPNEDRLSSMECPKEQVLKSWRSCRARWI
jgi:ATP-dependent exoDNAse (exonuclease V) alpha subunit